MPFTHHSPKQNHLLAALPQAEFELLEPQLELVSLPVGEMVYEPGQRLQHAYFPTTAVVSLYYVTESGAAAESAGVGNEGMVGLPLILGGGSTPSSAVVQIGGHAYRLERQQLQQAFAHTRLLQGLLLRYTQALLTQMAQTAACNRHHSVEQQLSRWLLLTQDRGPGREMAITQELVAGMLGVRRESVTAAAGTLKQQGYIRYRRGHITVLDPEGLQAHTCECYAVVKDELARLLFGENCRQDTLSARPSAPAAGQRLST